MIEIVPADTEALLQHVVVLTQEYVAEMVANIRQHIPDLDVSELTSEHDYDDIRRKFPGEHVPPFGRLYVATSGAEAAGMIALGKMSNDICEMRTLFVRPQFRGLRVGKKLADTVLQDARDIGYSHMRLDTLPFMQSALTMYRSLGFYDIPPYRDVSASLKKYICFIELDLRQS